MNDSMVPVFTTADRCDRCGAQAYAQFTRDDAASELIFCQHHIREFRDALIDDGWDVYFDTESLRSLYEDEGVNV